LLLLTLFQGTLFCQQDHVFALQNVADKRIAVGTTINDDTQLEPFTSKLTISGLAISGEIVLHSDSSLVRLILMDNYYNEYLIYEAYPILSGSRQFSVKEAGEETSLLNNITPSRVAIELVDASIYLKEIIISEEEPYQAKTKGALLLQQSMDKIDRINLNIQKTDQTWLAGETSISKLSYQEKKSMFGGSVPNFQGFEYYVGGIIVLPGAKDELDSRDTQLENLSQPESQYASEFSWRSRHREDWVTSVKDQTGCNSCWAFGTTAATELLVNLYFNRHLDYDLSEQNIISCTSGNCSFGGTQLQAYNYIKNTGIVMEDCFPYLGSDQDCSEMCGNPRERIKIDSMKFFYDEEDKKRAIINGATSASIDSWLHVVQIIGYKVIEAGHHLFMEGYDTTNYLSIEQDNPLIGETAWLCKNSWGESWGNNGYGYFIGDQNDIMLYSLSGPVSSLIFNEDYVLCTDNDGDGYYCWGIGPKPSHCPECPDEPDGDDSDRCIGPMDEYGNLKSSTPTPDAKDTLILYGQMVPDLYAAGSNIRWYSDITLQNLVHTGNVFPTGQTEIGDYTYYVTQTLLGCESDANAVSLSIWQEIPRPFGHDTVIYAGKPAILTVSGEQGATFKWYEDPLLNILLHTGESYETQKTDTGTYTYYITQTLYLLESAPDTVLLKIGHFVTIPDIAFLNALIEEGVDANGDGFISYSEAESVTSIAVNRKGIDYMSGIEAFVNLDTLDCSYNFLISLDVSGCTDLRFLDCYHNQLTSLDVSKITALKYLGCSENRFTSLDVSKNTALEELDCKRNRLTILDVSGCTDLRFLDCYSNQLTSLDVSGCTALEELDCSWNQLTSLDVSGCTALEGLGCPRNQLTSLVVSGCTALEDLDCNWNHLTSLDVSGCTALSSLECRSNQLISLDVSGCIALQTLQCYFNQLTSLDVSGCTALEELDCSNSQLTSLDVSGCTALKTLWCSNNQLTSLDVSGCTALTGLSCGGNQLTSLDVSGCTALTGLSCGENHLTSLDVSGCTALSSLDCRSNQLISLDVSGCIALQTLRCYSNQLTSLDVSGCTALKTLWCDYNPLTSLDVSGCTALKALWCNYNQLTSLDVSGCTALTGLSCSGNQLISLDVSKNTALEYLGCSENQLTSLDISNNSKIGTSGAEYAKLIISNMLTLHEVCVWTMPFPPTGVNIDTTGSPNVEFKDCGVGIEEYIPSELLIYPNPTNDRVTIETGIIGHYVIEITSLNGQRIYGTQKDGPTHQIDLSSFQKGVYFITIRSKGFVTTRKIIKL